MNNDKTHDFAEHSNQIELLDVHGGDLSHAQAAWTSTRKEITPADITRIPGLLMMLADREPLDPSPLHSSPFEKSTIRFRLEAEVASRIQVLRHRIGVSPNEESARYRELKGDRCFVPDDWPADEQAALLAETRAAYEIYRARLPKLTAHYVGRGMGERQARSRAKETARFGLLHAIRVRSDITFNFLSFMHFMRLRNEPHSQKEIRDIADTMLRLVRERRLFTFSLIAFGWDGRHGMENRARRIAVATKAVIAESREMAKHANDEHQRDLNDRIREMDAAAKVLWPDGYVPDATPLIAMPDGRLDIDSGMF